MVESTLNGVPVSVIEQHKAEIEANGDGRKHREERDELPRKLFATREEATSAIPANPPAATRPFLISKGDEELGWILAISYDSAISRAAAIEGYTATLGTPRGRQQVTPEVIKAKLATFSDEELAAMGLTRAVPGAGQATTVAATVMAQPEVQAPPVVTGRRGKPKGLAQ